MSIRFATALLLAGLLLGGCSGSSSDGIGPTNPESGNGAPPPPPAEVGSFKALFIAASGVWPYPTDLYFNGSDDGTLNILASVSFPQRTAMNRLDGFSTTASSYFRMSQPARDDAAMLNSSVRIIQAPMLRQSSGVYAPVGVLDVLAPGEDYSVRIAPETDAGGTVVEIVWLKPLAASTGVFCSVPGLPPTAICGNGYIVLVTTGIQNNSDTAATPDSDYLTIRTEAIAELGRSGGNPTFVPTCPGIEDATLNSICRLTYAQLAIGANPALGPAAINPATVILSYSFTTGSTRDVLAEMSQTHTAKPITAVPTGFTTTDLLAAAGLPANPFCPGCADAYTGSVQIPYFLTPPSAQDPTAPLTRTWTAADASPVPGIAATSRDITRFNLAPATVADLKIPLLVFKPNGNSPGGGVKPANGWPVVVFMHGITRVRADALAIADTYASLGFVVVAMDIVLHGITNTANPLYAGPENPLAAVLYGPDVRERTFDVDYINNTTGAAGPDGVIDPSGTHVINLTAPLVVRDGLRQTGSDLITLVKSLAAGSLDLDAVPGGDIDPDGIHYAGLSLGGIVGPTCICSEVNSFYLNAPGGPLTEILRTSPAFMTRINNGLAAANPFLVPGSSLYAQFFRELQAIWDGGDPTNYVASLALERPVLFTKVIGDAVVPNPTNDYWINAAGAEKVTAIGPQLFTAGTPKFVTFLSGDHGSLLNPNASLAVTVEMQRHAASLVASGGAAFQVFDPSLLEQ